MLRKEEIAAFISAALGVNQGKLEWVITYRDETDTNRPAAFVVAEDAVNGEVLETQQAP